MSIPKMWMLTYVVFSLNLSGNTSYGKTATSELGSWTQLVWSSRKIDFTKPTSHVSVPTLFKTKGGHKIICLWTYVSMDKYVHGHISGMCLFCPGLAPLRAATLAPKTEVTSENADVRSQMNDREDHVRTAVTDATVARVGAPPINVMGVTTGGRTNIAVGALPLLTTRGQDLTLTRVRATPSPLSHATPGAGHVTEM